MLVDVHAHIQFNAFKDDADEVIKRAIDADVCMVAPSSQISTSQRSIEYAEKYPGKIFAGVGLHPIHLKPAYFDPSEEGAPAFHTRVEEFSYGTYKKLAEDPRVVAIGETGLDYAEKLGVGERDREKQEELFRKQIELALEVNKSIVQHTRNGMAGGSKRDAHEDALRVISEYVTPPRGNGASLAPKWGGRGLRGVAHCYSGNLEQAKRYVELGFYVSFTGLITFVDTWEEVIKQIPLAHILTETDCPYMTPVPHRGKRNEPVYVKYVAEKIAEIKGISFEEVAEQTTQNAKTLFNLSLS